MRGGTGQGVGPAISCESPTGDTISLLDQQAGYSDPCLITGREYYRCVPLSPERWSYGNWSPIIQQNHHLMFLPRLRCSRQWGSESMNPGGSVESLCLLHLWGWMTQCHFLLPLLHLQPLFVSKIWQKPATVRLLVRGLGPGSWRKQWPSPVFATWPSSSMLFDHASPSHPLQKRRLVTQSQFLQGTGGQPVA